MGIKLTSKPTVLEAAKQASMLVNFAEHENMRLFNACLAGVHPSELQIEFPHQTNLPQQNSYKHVRVLSRGKDGERSYAAFSLIPKSRRVLNIKLKVNFLAPAQGNNLLRVEKPFTPGDHPDLRR